MAEKVKASEALCSIFHPSYQLANDCKKAKEMEEKKPYHLSPRKYLTNQWFEVEEGYTLGCDVENPVFAYSWPENNEALARECVDTLTILKEGKYTAFKIQERALGGDIWGVRKKED